MNAVLAPQTYIVSKPFERVLKLVRAALEAAELDLVDEFEPRTDLPFGQDRGVAACRVLLVSCPILELEAMALERASAVFFPLHLVVSADDDQTFLYLMNPVDLFEARLPAGARGPLDKLVARVAAALGAMPVP